MAEPHLDHPGEIHWFKGETPRPVIGPCPHTACKHLGHGVIAWGPSLDRYELVECGLPGDGGCGAECRAWSDGDGRITTVWLHVAAPAGAEGGA